MSKYKDGRPLLQRNWVGWRVRTVIEMSNGWMKIPAGSLAIVTGVSVGTMRLYADPCPHCGVAAKISKVRPMDVEFIEVQSGLQRVSSEGAVDRR